MGSGVISSGPRLFVAEHAADDAFCHTVRAAMDAGVPEPAEVLDEEIALVEDVRRASHLEVPSAVLDLVDGCLEAHRPAIAAFFGLSLRCREGAGLLRYEAGGFYRPHIDRAEVLSWPAAARRAISVVLFLGSSREADPSGDFSGGVLRLFLTEIDGAPLDVVPRRGMLVAFPSETLHEVLPVLTGHRDVVVDWFY